MFCNYCGHKNPDDGNFCSKCGKALCDAGPEAQIAQKELYAVTVFRESQAYLINPPINIMVDGKEPFSVSNGGTLKIQLPAGEHRFLFSQTMRKREVTVSLPGDKLIRLRWNRLTGAIETDIKDA